MSIKCTLVKLMKSQKNLGFVGLMWDGSHLQQIKKLLTFFLTKLKIVIIIIKSIILTGRKK